MRINKNLIMVLPLLTLCLVSSADTARANVIAGVQPGDWIKYDAAGPSDTPGQFVNYWMNATVIYVSGTLITITIDSDSTDLNNSYRQVDIATDCWIDGAFPLFVSANLSSGDDVPGGGLTLTINDTTQHFGRDAAHIGITSSDEVSDIYWDRQKGVLLEFSGRDPNDASSQTTIKMVATNMWTSSPALFGLDAWVWAAIIIVVVAVLAISTIALTRHRKKLPTTTAGPLPQYPPPPPPPPPL
jgi:hypothetical protein